MSGLLVAFTTPEIALSAATAKTVLQLITPTNQRALVRRVGVFFDGTSTTAEPVQIRILRQTTAIGGTPTAVTGVKVKPAGAGETVQVTAAYSAGGAEPTASDVLDVYEIHPQAGFDGWLPLSQEIDLAGGTRLGIECTAPATVNCRAKAWVDE